MVYLLWWLCTSDFFLSACLGFRPSSWNTEFLYSLSCLLVVVFSLLPGTEAACAVCVRW